jgi:phage tail-like protein
MPPFSKLPRRLSPYPNFKFKLKWEDTPGYVAGISKMSALKRTTATIEHREGGDPSTTYKSPGLTKFDPITLERGVTHDTAFEEWASKVWNFHGGFGAESSLKDFRKNITVDVFNEAGQKVISYQIFRCWVSEFQALGDLDANGNATLIQSIKLENEGWQRDVNVKEPEPAQFEPQVG